MILPAGDLALDRVEEADESMMPIALHAAASDLPSRTASLERAAANAGIVETH
jgi:hypothetical protein